MTKTNMPITQDDQPVEIKTGTLHDLTATITKVEALQQRLASWDNPDDPKLAEAITKLEAGANRYLSRQAEIDELKQAILTKYIREFCYNLYPYGRSAAGGGYWEVPAPNLIKISYKTGLVFNWEKPEDRNPMKWPDGRYMDVMGVEE